MNKVAESMSVKSRGIFYDGMFHEPKSGKQQETYNPSTGESLGEVAHGDASDIDAAVAAAKRAGPDWRAMPPLERAKLLREIGTILRDNARELAMIDAANGGNPVTEMTSDALAAAAGMDFFAGLVTEMKGQSIPMGPDVLNFSVREPLGVVGRIIPFNHPFMFCAGKSAAPLAAGNTVVIKPPHQAPLSSLRLAELIGQVLPSGVFNVVPGGAEAGARLASHPDVAMIALIGSVPTGRAVMEAAAKTVKNTMLELGGKNALIAFPDADPKQVGAAIVSGMNFTWCGQSCGSTSRAFIHDDIYEETVKHVLENVKRHVPGIATEAATTMGAIISKQQLDRILGYIESGKSEGAKLIYGGKRPTDPNLKNGFFVEPTIFGDVTMKMRIAYEEIFGPVLSILRWSDREKMFAEVNQVEYGLTAAIWTNNLTWAQHAAMSVEAGYVWINEVSKHFLGAPFGGYKQSGLGREECLEELLSFTQQKNIHMRLNRSF